MKIYAHQASAYTPRHITNENENTVVRRVMIITVGVNSNKIP